MPYFRSLAHSGTPHEGMIPHSGRYAYGSGKERFQHESNIVKTYERLSKNGLTDSEIAKSMNYDSVDEMQTKLAETGLMVSNSTESIADKANAYREKGMTEMAIALELGFDSINKMKMAIKVENAKKKSERDTQIDELYYKQGITSYSEIGRIVGCPESTVRERLKSASFNKKGASEQIADALKAQLEKFDAIDIGVGSENLLGVSKNKFDTAIKLLEEQGYHKWYFDVPQAENPLNPLWVKALARPEVKYSEIDHNKERIGLVSDFIYAEDGGRTIRGIEKPSSVDSSRVLVRYGDQGGKEKDGFIQIRRGVEDLSLGNSLYAQARIVVDNKYYLKGMAAYTDESMPEGIDIIFNTKKNSDEYTKLETLKKLTKKDVVDPETGEVTKEIDWDNPFKSTLKTEDGKIVGQTHYIDKDGNEKLGCINIVRSEGDWDNWGKSLSAQFLSKQPLQLINQQLDKTYKQKEDEFRSIAELTQPEVKASLLTAFAEDCDKSASELKALKLPGQSTKVILPVNSLKNNEVYAPTYPDGEELILIRYPHGGTFEIPRVYNNINNKEGQKIISPIAQDAIGVSSASASQLSGADFDGDTVVVIPVKNLNIKTDDPLPGLKDFDTDMYAFKDGRKSDINTQQQMGVITNLITDMTLLGADTNELERAVKHSMVVIDSEKHNLDYKRSYKENGIADLQLKYQGKVGGGAATLISKAGSEADPPERVEKTTFKIRTDEEQAWFEENEDAYYNDELDKQARNKWINIRNKLTPEEYESKMQGNKIYAYTNATHPTYVTIKRRTDEQQQWLDNHKTDYDEQKLENKDRKKYNDLLKTTMAPEKFDAKLTKINEGEEYSGKTSYRVNSNGDIVKIVSGKENTVTSNKMAEVSDAFDLITVNRAPHEKEIAYGNYANKMKALANEARKETYLITPSRSNSEMRKEYAAEVASLNSKLQIVAKNRPLERKAQLATDAYLAAAKKDNPDMSKEDIKKFRLQTINEQRRRFCSNKKEYEIVIEPREWEAITKGALSSSKIKDILKSADMDQVREYATPYKTHTIPPYKVRQIKSMLDNVKDGKPTLQDIADECGVSTATVAAYAKGGKG